MKAMQCPSCQAPLQLPESACWRCEVNLEVACGDCGLAPYDLGAGMCFRCGSAPTSLELVPRKTQTTQ